MEFRFAMLRLVTVGAICITVILASGFNILFPKSDNISPTLNSATEDIDSLQKGEKNDEGTNESLSEKPQAEESPQQSEAVSKPVASSGNVLGKVIEKFITPYTANTSYNNVYIKNSTGLDIDIKALLSSPLGYKIEKNKNPQVLIMHTHTTESFMTESRDYYTDLDLKRTTDSTKNMVALGNIIAEKLNGAGIVTLHDTTMHDYPAYSGSYSRSAETVCSYLKKYPDIKIVLDLHRDAIAQNDTDKVKITADIEGKKAAQVMLVMGAQSGSVKNFPNWKENLKLAVRLQQNLEVMYPSLARSMSLVPKNYNQSLSSGSMLIEIGTDGNSLEEVSYSAELLGNALVSTFNNIG